MSSYSCVIAYTDGSCNPNPGPGGWGVVLLLPDGSRVEHHGGFPGETTNNRMEMVAAIKALRLAPDGPMEIRTDSQLVMMCALGKWKRKANKDLWRSYDREAAKRKGVGWRWIRGHNGDKWNERADALANAAVGRGLSRREDDETPTVTPVPAL